MYAIHNHRENCEPYLLRRSQIVDKSHHANHDHQRRQQQRQEEQDKNKEQRTKNKEQEGDDNKITEIKRDIMYIYIYIYTCIYIIIYIHIWKINSHRLINKNVNVSSSRSTNQASFGLRNWPRDSDETHIGNGKPPNSKQNRKVGHVENICKYGKTSSTPFRKHNLLSI